MTTGVTHVSRMARLALAIMVLTGWTALPPSLQQAKSAEENHLWELAKAKQQIHRFSTLFTAQQVRDHLATDEGIDAAINWCKRTGVTKVYIETFRY